MVLTQTGRLFAGLIAISALGAQAVQTILDPFFNATTIRVMSA